jgi:DNA (cytosine-5)-methyltransferase 1
MSAYYNEHDRFAAAWLRELIKAGLIADGEVDERDIQQVSADDVRGFTQCHFFAGIGGWSYALRLAGWPDDRAVWTGSCPCQPFSSAGKGDGAADPRHLWPAWFRLIAECRPAIVFGEQVASADGLGWFDAVSTDLEAAHYALGAADLCAPSVGAFDIRQRLWFVADTVRATGEWGAGGVSGAEAAGGRAWEFDGRGAHRLADGGEAGGVGVATGIGCERERHQPAHSQPMQAGAWAAAEWIYCRDGKYRPVEPGTFPLAHGIPARVGRLRGYGNAIKPQVAAAVSEAYCDARGVTA